MKIPKKSSLLVNYGQEIFPTVCASTRRSQSENVEETSFLMKPFSTASGEVVNPYKILNVSRRAERKEIKDAYRKLSKRYHPDIVRHSKVLPGKCNNHDDVEDEWERIQISYNILSERKTRMQYDRHEVINDPGAAMQRALLGAAVAGLFGIGKGIFHVGSKALDHALATTEEEIVEVQECLENKI
jgi:DnaJ-class molecular chaperone